MLVLLLATGAGASGHDVEISDDATDTLLSPCVG